jgi:uncharacterized protein (TIGR00730 family)
MADSAEKKHKAFPSAHEDVQAAVKCVVSKQTQAAAYKLAYTDVEFLLRDELRPVRLQLELLKPELLQQEHGIEDTVVVFGSSRIPAPETADQKMAAAQLDLKTAPANPELIRRMKIAERLQAKSKYYEEARKLGQYVASRCFNSKGCKLIIITGGGPGIMEAANRGASDAGADSIGLNIVLPHEQSPNPYITPELCFQFHYFAIRKMHFLLRARALVAFPGGYGTLDELFESLTLIQTRKIKPIPILLFGETFWRRLIDFDFMVDEGVISPEDINLFQFIETAEEAWQAIVDNYGSGQPAAE